MTRGITQNDVFAAADALLVRGERPTIERVRQELGRGSPNTVNRLLDDWWGQLARRMSNKSPDGLPTSVVELCRRLYTELQNQARSEAEARASIQEQALAGDQAKIEQERQSFAIDRARLETLATTRRQEAEDLRSANQTALKHSAELETTLVAERRAAATAAAAGQKLVADRERRIGELEREVERVRTQWQGNETHWLKEIDLLRTEVKSRKAEHDKLSRQFEHRLDDLQNRLDSELKAHQESRKQIRQLESALAKERQAHLRVLGQTQTHKTSTGRRTKAAVAR